MNEKSQITQNELYEMILKAESDISKISDIDKKHFIINDENYLLCRHILKQNSHDIVMKKLLFEFIKTEIKIVNQYSLDQDD